MKNLSEKWMKKWEDAGVFSAVDFSPKPKFYGLVEFPYPSGYGLHMGHMRAFLSMEIISRMKRLQGYNVLFPFGYDAFGLPTENYAIKTGISPQQATKQNIENMRKQVRSVGFSFDYTREINTTSEDYYKWTQWIFIQLYKKGLAYKDLAQVNYCPNCKCILSNEESQGGKCDRCNSDVVQRDKHVWFLRIREYAEKLLSGINEIDCINAIAEQQINWIGKSTGAEINFETTASENIKVYTTRPDTIFGATFLVISPEHEFVAKHSQSIKNLNEVTNYVNNCKLKTEFERLHMNKQKTGVKLEGVFAINPFTKKQMSIFIADYVLNGYGTGAIMAVPAHDERDYEFAKKFGCEIIEVIAGGDVSKEAYTSTESGKLVNSGFLNGLNVKQAIEKIVGEIENKKIGTAKTNYLMKDWAFNRQRYWGEPIPIIYCNKCGMVTVPEEDLPVKLPVLSEFKPGENGESPLAEIESFVNCTCPKCGGKAKRETDTMPQWAGSSWYYLRYIDPANTQEFAAKDKLNYWGKVDWYNGGMEHVTRHLLYSRFWHKVLFDLGLVPFSEPYAKRTAQGLILGEDGQKMSKSLGNVVDVDKLVEDYGADVARLYTMFVGDYEKNAVWSSQNIVGCKRFLEKVKKVCLLKNAKQTESEKVLTQKTIKKVGEDITALKFNTAIAACFEFVNEILSQGTIDKENLKTFLILLYPFAPFAAEELNEQFALGNMLALCKWPTFDENSLNESEVEIPVQVNGKLKGKIKIKSDAKESDAICAAKNAGIITGDMQIVKTIFVAGKILNIVQK